MKNIQVQIKIDGGETLKSDVVPVNEQDEQSVAQLKQLIERVGDLSTFSIISDGDQVFINPKKIVYIKLAVLK